MESSPVHSCPTLPFELIVQIVLLSSEDKPTLNALSRTGRSLYLDATKHLYASTTVLHLRWADRNATSGMQFLSTIHKSPHHAALVRVATIATVPNPNPIPTRVVVNELQKMINITSLVIRPTEGGAIGEIPKILYQARFRYKLKRLKWRGTRTHHSLYFLCSLMEAHRTTLEAVDLRFDYVVGYRISLPQSTIVAIVRQALNGPLPETTSVDAEDELQARPLPFLRDITGSLEVLDIFLPLIASSTALKILRVVPPDPTVSLDLFLPNISHLKTPTPVLEIVKQTPLVSLSLDLRWGWKLDLEQFMACQPSLESLELRGIRNNEPMDSFAIFSPLQQLRSLTLAMVIDIDDPPSYGGDANLEGKIMCHFQPTGLIPSVFAHCASLQEVRMELDGPAVLRPLWQVWLRVKMSKYPGSGGSRGTLLEQWWDVNGDQYPTLKLFTYMGITV